jgi:hypothetical protein
MLNVELAAPAAKHRHESSPLQSGDHIFAVGREFVRITSRVIDRRRIKHEISTTLG